MLEFRLSRLSDRLFFIITRDQLDPSGTIYKELPIKVYGFLKVVGKSLKTSYVFHMNLSEEVSPEELHSLSEEAKKAVFS